MNPIEAAKLTYKSGDIIEVSKDFIHEKLIQIEQDLGFLNKEYNFNIFIIPDELHAKIPINAAVQLETNTFATSKQQHEATIYHEGVHYVMGKNGLLFAPNVTKGTLYDRFVDETIAELATSQKYGYSDLFKGDSVEMYKKRVSQNPDLIEKTLANFSTIPFEIAMRHRNIEDKFRQTQDFEKITKDIKMFYQYLSEIKDINQQFLLSEAIRTIATDNAKRLLNKGIKIKDLVASLNDGVNVGWDSYGMYFVDIINELNYQ